MFLQPSVYHGTSPQFRVLTWSGNDLTGHFDATRVNGHEPFLPLQPSPDGVSYASVFHMQSVDLNQKLGNILGPVELRLHEKPLWRLPNHAQLVGTAFFAISIIREVPENARPARALGLTAGAAADGRVFYRSPIGHKRCQVERI
jgi:hypothetical protein